MRLQIPALQRAAAACLALVAACSDPLGPDDVADTYVLRRVAGESLPAVVFENEYGVSRVLTDTIRLDADGWGTASSVSDHVTRADGTRHGPVSSTRALRYEVSEGRIEIEYLCPPNALCAAGPHLVARRTDEGLVAEQALGQRVPQLYVRIPTE